MVVTLRCIYNIRSGYTRDIAAQQCKSITRCGTLRGMNNPTCHPDRPLHALGLCQPCYSKQNYRSTHEYLRLKLRSTKLRLLKDRGGRCVDCGFHGHPAALDFDHIDPETKVFTIGTELGRSWPELLKEARRCEVRCANCRRIRTHAYSLDEVKAFGAEEARYCLHCSAPLTGRSAKYCGPRCGGAYRQARWRRASL